MVIHIILGAVAEAWRLTSGWFSRLKDTVWDFVSPFSADDRALLILAAFIAVFFILSLVFAFIAVYLRISNTLKAKRWADLEARWQTALFEVTSGDLQPDELLDLVAKRDRLYFVDYLVQYAVRFRGEELLILHRLAQRFLPLIRKWLTRGDPERRARTAQTLGILGGGEYMEDLVSALDDPSPLVSMIAARSLVERREMEYLKPVIEHLHRYTHWHLNYLATLLASVGPQAAPLLREMYADLANSSQVRALAAEALCRLKDIESADIAAETLKESHDRDLLASSLRLLKIVGRREHVDAVRSSCDTDDNVVKAQAFRALGSLGDAKDVGSLRAELSNPSPWVASHAARSLCEIGQEQVLMEYAESGGPGAEIARQVLAEEAA